MLFSIEYDAARTSSTVDELLIDVTPGERAIEVAVGEDTPEPVVALPDVEVPSTVGA